MQDVLEVKNELSQKIDYGLVFEDLAKKVEADLSITINGVEDKAGYKLADTRRKEWVKVRTGIDKRRKEMNAAAREHIKRVDAVAAEFTELAGKAEDHVTRLVDEIDAEIQRVEQEKLDKVFNDRNAQLQHVGINLPRLVIESLTDAEIQKQIDDKIETDRLRKAEAERMAAEKAAAEKLAAEREEANRIEAEKLAAERAAFAAQQAAAKAEADLFAKIEAEKLAAERAELERQKSEQAELQRSLQREQERLAQIERDRIAAEQQAERDRIAEENHLRLYAERKERERIEAEAKAAREAEEAKAEAAAEEAAKAHAEALRPDREKLLSVAAAIDAVEIPRVSTEMAGTVQAITKIISQAVTEITLAVHSV